MATQDTDKKYDEKRAGFVKVRAPRKAEFVFEDQCERSDAIKDCDAPQRVPQVHEQMKRNDRHIMELQENLARLEHQLNGLLRPEPEDVGGNGCVRPDLVPLADTLQYHGDLLEGLNTQIVSITNRLEV